MAFPLIVIGLICILSAIKGTLSQLGNMLVNDFTGQKGFLIWIAAIGGVGAIGYIPPLQKFSRVFLALVIISIFLAHNGFFEQLMAALQGGVQAPKGGVSLSASGQSAGNMSGGAGQNQTGDPAGALTIHGIGSKVSGGLSALGNLTGSPVLGQAGAGIGQATDFLSSFNFF